jgi:hypothetical protein
MTEVFNQLASKIGDFYNEVFSFFPPYVGVFFNFLALVLLVVCYSILIWKFYKFVARKNILQLNLNQYNQVEHSFFAKIVAGIFYFIEYLLILPLFVFVVFTVFTLFLIVLSENISTSQILIISAVVIATIRMTAYYKENLSQDIAKMFPFLLLTITLLNPNTFADNGYIEKFISHLTEIPAFLGQIKYYLLFIICLEVILRFFDLILSLFDLGEPEQEE